MFGLIRDNAIWNFMYLAFIVPGLYFYWATTRTALDRTVVLMTAGFMYVVVLAPVILLEFKEERFKGRAFLATLPLLPREYVAAKFLPVLANTVLYAVFGYIMFARLESPPQLLHASRVYLLLNGAVCLAAAGLCYIALFRFGFGWLGKLLVVILVACYLAPFALDGLVLPRLQDRLPAMIGAALHVPLPLPAAGSIALFGCLMEIAVRIKKMKYIVY